MNNAVKLVIYLVLLILAGVSGYFGLSRFKEVMNTDRTVEIDIEKERPKAVEPEVVETPGQSNVVTAGTNLVVTNAAADTNVVSTNSAQTTPGTNAVPMVAASTNAAPSTNSSPTPSIAKAEDEAGAEVPTALGGRGNASGKGKKGGIGLWMAVFILSLIGLGLMLAMDVSQFMGNRALKVMYNDEGEGMATPEYDLAEQVWADGKHLEAIGMMRDYLKKNPREQHVALRIAEIYEKDLGNHLAAALEYEEVLQQKLPAERWGWAAIHLCNLYFKLNNEQKGYELLRRIVNEYPDTGAAEKARKRLEQVDGAGGGQISTEASSTGQASAPGALPPGFRKKK